MNLMKFADTPLKQLLYSKECFIIVPHFTVKVIAKVMERETVLIALIGVMMGRRPLE